MQSSKIKDICYFPESESLHHQKYSIFHLTPSTFNSINQHLDKGYLQEMS